MKPEYQSMLNRLIPDWRSRTSLEIIGALLEAINAYERDSAEGMLRREGL